MVGLDNLSGLSNLNWFYVLCMYMWSSNCYLEWCSFTLSKVDFLDGELPGKFPLLLLGWHTKVWKWNAVTAFCPPFHIHITFLSLFLLLSLKVESVSSNLCFHILNFCEVFIMWLPNAFVTGRNYREPKSVIKNTPSDLKPGKSWIEQDLAFL